MLNSVLLLAAEEGVHHDNGYQLPGDINEVYYGTAAFLLVIALIVWKGAPAIRKAIDGRTSRIASELNEAADARADARKALDATTSSLPDTDAEAARIRSEAESTAESLKVDLVAKAEAEAEAIRARGVADVESMKAQAQSELQAEVAIVARRAAEQAVTESLDAATQGELIDDYISQVSRLG